MSDTNPPLDKAEKNKNLQPLRGHPQQQQGHIPNQEQAGATDHRQRQQDDAVGSNRSQAQQQSDAQELQDKASEKSPLALVKRPADPS